MAKINPRFNTKLKIYSKWLSRKYVIKNKKEKKNEHPVTIKLQKIR